MQPFASQALGEFGDARLVADRRLRIGAAGPRLGRVFAARAMHAIEIFRLLVVGLEHVVFQRPFRRDAVAVAHAVEVGLAQPEQRGAVELGIAADPVMQPRLETVAAGRLPGLVGLVAGAAKYLRGVPVLALARQVLAALDQQNALAGLRQPPRRGPAARPGADDDDVVAVVSHWWRSRGTTSCRRRRRSSRRRCSRNSPTATTPRPCRCPRARRCGRKE